MNDAKPDEREEDYEREAEPPRMSWFVIAFMTACLLMTTAMLYYVWLLLQKVY